MGVPVGVRYTGTSLYKNFYFSLVGCKGTAKNDFNTHKSSLIFIQIHSFIHLKEQIFHEAVLSLSHNFAVNQSNADFLTSSEILKLVGPL